MRNYEIEQRWVDIWNDLLDLQASGVTFVDGESYTRLSMEDARGFVQDTVYDGYDVVLETMWYEGRKVVTLKKGANLES